MAAIEITCLAEIEREVEREREGGRECMFASRNQFVSLIMHRLCCCCCSMNAFLATCRFVVVSVVVATLAQRAVQ